MGLQFFSIVLGPTRKKGVALFLLLGFLFFLLVWIFLMFCRLEFVKEVAPADGDLDHVEVVIGVGV